MPELAKALPCRKGELVFWTAANEGTYLVRNRHAGQTYQLGEEEHFLLARIDGRHSAEQLCLAFADHFGQPLSAEELEEFLDLGNERGLLQPAGAAATAGCISHPSAQPGGLQIRPTIRSALLQRLAGRLLAMLAAMVAWLAGLLQGAAQRIHWFRLSRLDYVARPNDVFIVTYPRSGTTWMQMILYQLTSDGSMDFPHIAEYCPWFERSLRSAHGFETRPSPRLFKSHLPYQRIPKGPCKYIYVARDGRDVAVSYYHLCRRYNGYQGTFAEFFELFLRGKVDFGSWFQHVRAWWAHRHDPSVLFLTYEELTSDLEKSIRKIIAFCGFNVPPERLPGILQRCSFSFMKQHETQFDPALETLWEQGIQLNGFLRKGCSGDGKETLNREQLARFDARFQKELGRTSGGPVRAPEPAVLTS